MPDTEIEELIGPGLEPSADFVASLRRRTVAEWHGVATTPQAAPRRRWVTAAAAAAVVALIASVVVFVSRDSSRTMAPAETMLSTTTRPGDPLRLATIVFDEPTTAWVASNGTSALYERDGRWFLGDFDGDGLIAELPVDSVDPAADHQVERIVLAPPEVDISANLVVIDGDLYQLAGGEWRRGACYLCTAYVAPPPTANSAEGAWTVKYVDLEWSVAQPAGWDGLEPWLATESVGSGPVVMVARTATSTLVWKLTPDGAVVVTELTELWKPVGVSPGGLLAFRDDPSLQNYTVFSLPWSPTPVPASAIDVRWVITELKGAPVDRSPMPWFLVEMDGSVSGFDGCVAYSAQDEVSTPSDPACVPIRPSTSALRVDAQNGPAVLTGDGFSALAVDEVPSSLWSSAGAFTVAGSGSAVTFAPDGWLSVGTCLDVALWQVPETSHAFTLTVPSDRSIDETCGADDVARILAETDVALHPGWLVSDTTVLSLVEVSVQSVPFAFGLSTATTIDVSSLSGTRIEGGYGEIGAVMTPAGRIFVNRANGDGLSVDEYVDGELRPTGLTEGVFTGAGDDLYSLTRQGLTVYSEIDGVWTKVHTLPAPAGECYLLRAAFETVCGGAHAAVQPPSTLPGVWVTGTSVELWSGGKQIVYTPTLEPEFELLCDSDACLSEFSFIPGGGAVWSPGVVGPAGYGDIVRLAAVLRPGLEPIVITGGVLDGDQYLQVIGVNGAIAYVLFWNGTDFTLAAVPLPPAGPGPTF